MKLMADIGNEAGYARGWKEGREALMAELREQGSNYDLGNVAPC